MRERGDKTRYGLPPQRDPFEPFPTEIPWDAPLSEISGWWLDIHAGDGSSVRYPLRLMAGEIGWTVTLRQAVDRLRRDGKPPARVLLIAHGGLETKRPNAAGKWLVLVGE